MPARVLIVITVLALLAAACSGNLRRVSGQPPQVAIQSLTLDERTVVAEIGLRNINDRPLELRGIRIDLSLNEQRLGRGQRDLDLTIAPRSREVIRVSLTPEAAGLRELQRLDSGETGSQSWSLGLVLTDGDDRSIDTQASGWLHPVPGQPGRFR